MNEHNQTTRSSDLPANERHQRLLAIQEEEELERRRRENAVRARKRAEYIRQKKKEQLIAWIKLIGVGLLVLLAVIGIIVGIAKSVSGGKSKAAAEEQRQLLLEQTQTVSAFREYPGTLYDPASAYFPAGADALIKAARERSAADARTATAVSFDAYTADWVLKDGSAADVEAFKARIADMPISKRNYIFTQTDSADSVAADTYFHDTNVAYISAVAAICLAENDASFLDTLDEHSSSDADVSVGMTVRAKLDAAVSYLFGNETTGLKYNALSCLAVVLSSDNNGTDGGKPSDMRMTYRTGYANTYINLRFNRAMNDLAALYTLLGDNQNAARYQSVAADNADAIRQKFFDADKQRFIGWIDSEGVRHDHGDVLVNLLAIDCGIASDDAKNAILSWLCGTRVIESDDITGDAVLKGAVSFTAPAGAARYGTQEQIASADERASLLVGATALRVLIENEKLDYARTLCCQLGERYTSGGAARFETSAADGLLCGGIMSAYFNVSADGCSIIPRISATAVPDTEEGLTQKTLPFGITNVKAGATKLGVLHTEKYVFVTSRDAFNGTLRIGGLLPDTAYLVETVDTGAETGVTSAVELTASVSGTLTIENIPFGDRAFLRIGILPEKK